MELNEAWEQLLIRRYRWALREFTREVEDGYPLLRSIRNHAVRVLLSQFDGAPLPNPLQVAAALVKRSHPEALSLCGETRSPEEQRLADRWRLCATANAGPSADAARPGLGETPARKGRLVAIVNQELEPVLGSGTRLDRNEWEYVTTFGDWLVKTAVDFSAAGGQPGVCYWQYLYRFDLPPFTPGVPRIDILSLLGIFSESSWEINSEDDASRAAESLRRICEHFLRGVPALVDGLSSEGPVGVPESP